MSVDILMGGSQGYPKCERGAGTEPGENEASWEILYEATQ
jgi:hypothetical protein